MRPQLTETEGSLTLDIYGGYGEIGGNCIVIKDSDRKIVFDNGIRFQVLRRYYGGRIQPVGPSELVSLGAIPTPNIFEDANSLYISHFHLDHLGLLSALPPGTKIYVPSADILEKIEDWYRSSPTWLAWLPHELHAEVTEMKPYHEDENGVISIPVSHSSFPSYAFVYRGYEKTVFYSGDLRVNGPDPKISTLSNIEKALGSQGSDIALLEGTNIGSVETPIAPEEFKSMLSRILMESEMAVVSIDPLDFELFTAVSELASLNGRKIVLASPRLVDVLPQWLLASNMSGLELGVASELEKPSPIPVEYVSLEQDILRNPENFLLLQEPTGFLMTLRQMRLWNKELFANATAILTTPEPLEAESAIEEETLVSWLYSLGVQVYRVRLSGHYYPHELKKIIKAVRPKRVIPVHTRSVRAMMSLVKI